MFYTVSNQFPGAPDFSTERQWDYILLQGLPSPDLFSHQAWHFHSQPSAPAPVAYTKSSLLHLCFQTLPNLNPSSNNGGGASSRDASPMPFPFPIGKFFVCLFVYFFPTFHCSISHWLVYWLTQAHQPQGLEFKSVHYITQNYKLLYFSTIMDGSQKQSIVK